MNYRVGNFNNDKFINGGLYGVQYIENDGSKTMFILNTSGGVVEVKQIPNFK